jgi:hypothetical protein
MVSAGEGKQAAYDCLMNHGYLARSGPLVPVDPVRIGVELGVRCYDAALPTDIGGAVVKKVGEPLSILVQSRSLRVEARLAYGLALGHYLGRVWGREDLDEFVYYDARMPLERNLGAPGKESNYAFARAFVLHLLMPEGSGADMFSLCANCRVPLSAARARLSSE